MRLVAQDQSMSARRIGKVTHLVSRKGWALVLEVANTDPVQHHYNVAREEKV